METEEQRVIPFQLQFDKPVALQIRIAEWNPNPEKDLLAMVTEDSKNLLHRFNWQRLWTITTRRSITSLCWRPDGKAIAVGLEDGTVSLHDVEKGVNTWAKNIKSEEAKRLEREVKELTAVLEVIPIEVYYRTPQSVRVYIASHHESIQNLNRMPTSVQYGGQYPVVS